MGCLLIDLFCFSDSRASLSCIIHQLLLYQFIANKTQYIPCLKIFSFSSQPFYYSLLGKPLEESSLAVPSLIFSTTSVRLLFPSHTTSMKVTNHLHRTMSMVTSYSSHWPFQLLFDTWPLPPTWNTVFIVSSSIIDYSSHFFSYGLFIFWLIELV